MATLPVLLEAVTFRANLYSTSDTANPADLKSTLTAWMHGQDTDKTITIYGMQYSVEPGPCGVTVPHLYATRCSPPDMNNSNSQCHCNIICSNLLFKTKLHSVYRARYVRSGSNKPLCSRLQQRLLQTALLSLWPLCLLLCSSS